MRVVCVFTRACEFVCSCMCNNSKNKPKCIIIIWITKYTQHILICVCSYIQYNKWGFCICVCVCLGLPTSSRLKVDVWGLLEEGVGGTGCTVWYCVGVCAQKVKYSPHSLPYPGRNNSPNALSVYTYSIVVLERKFFCKWPKASLSPSLFSFAHSFLPFAKLKRGRRSDASL